MTLVEMLPWIAGFSFILLAIAVAANIGAGKKNLWVIPAGFSALFLAWSLAAVISEGPTGFWPEHTRNMWGNQIWFDLLLAAGVAWFFLAPRAKALGMNIYPWLLLIVCTGSIGILAMLSRYLFLKERARRT